MELTKTELRVIKLICKDKTSKEIGEQLGYTYRTVEDHRNRINKKLKTNSAVGVVLWAIKHGVFRIKVEN